MNFFSIAEKQKKKETTYRHVVKPYLQYILLEKIRNMYSIILKTFIKKKSFHDSKFMQQELSQWMIKLKFGYDFKKKMKIKWNLFMYYT